jgi:hypothetical protein
LDELPQKPLLRSAVSNEGVLSMTRIYCRTPSTGYPENLVLADVPATLTTIPGADAPDYSVPDPSNQYEVRDPLDPTRAIIPGQIFFLTPLSITNKSGNQQSLTVILLQEDGTSINFGTAVVPAGDTAYIPLNGRSLLKRDPVTVYGDRLQVQASAPNVFDIWTAADLSPASQNIGVFVP